MSRSWNGNYDALPPAAMDVLRAIAVLELPTIDVDELAAVVESGPDTITSAVDTLRQAGWVMATGPGAGTLVAAAERWLRDVEMTTAEPEMVAELAGRYAAYVTASLDVDQLGVDQVAHWLGQRRTTVLGAIRAATRAGRHASAIAVAMATWQVADHVPDPSWWRDLAQLGEEAARQARDRDAFFTVLDRSAITFAGAGEHESAVEQWGRAANLAHRWKDYGRTVRVLTALGGLYQVMGLWSQAADLYLELIDEHHREHDSLAAATAMIELGATMVAGSQPEDAVTYLSRADERLTAASPDATLVTMHARALELWGQALWDSGQSGSARRRWERALAMLVDHPGGEVAADRVRALLATAADQRLGADE